VEKCHSLGAKPNDNIDDAAAFRRRLIPVLQQSTFPTGAYIISKTIRVRGNLRKIVGMEALFIRFLLYLALRYEQGTAGPLIVERLNVNG